MDLARQTLATLTEHDWSQRYANSLINYDGRIWYVQQCYGEPIKMRMKDISAGGPVDDENEVHDPIRAAEDKVQWYAREIVQYELYVQHKQEAKLAVEADIMQRYEELKKQIKNAEDKVEKLRAEAILQKLKEVVKKKAMKQDIQIDLNLISLDRPRAGWYQFDGKAGYLAYRSAKQFSRGFSFKHNCSIFSPVLDFGWTDMSLLLTEAFFGKKIGRTKVSMDDLRCLELMGHKLLSRQMIVHAHHSLKGSGLIYYRAKRIATYTKDGVVVAVPAFLDEIKEVLSFEPNVGVADAG